MKSSDHICSVLRNNTKNSYDNKNPTYLKWLEDYELRSKIEFLEKLSKKNQT